MIKNASKVIGYFSYTVSGNVFCDGGACVISGTEALMRDYLEEMSPDNSERDLIKKTRFGEIMNGLLKGGAYAFDQDSYRRFLPLAKKNGLDSLPDLDKFFSEASPTGLHFVRVEFDGD